MLYIVDNKLVYTQIAGPAQPALIDVNIVFLGGTGAGGGQFASVLVRYKCKQLSRVSYCW